ncbi:hypothetical protein CDV36_004442 [Fusarium kuroshium]|uniref:Peptidase S8/S53 domain-containing protein n=1 Tax=Fusarium kuroshium TaxID=2010991 RepID=A0A3M2SF61_9HYPO|nr:hypothetical protein CDV36_004442 [Fusarium kuroshium]
MRLFHTLLTLPCVASALARHNTLLRRDGEDAAPAVNETNVDPKRFIIEFEDGTNPKATADKLADRPDVKLVKVFDSDVFKGACVETPKENLDTLQEEKSVIKAWQVKKVTLAPMKPLQTFGKDAAGINTSIHHMTGVDKLHADGVLGKGAVVAVVDTGVIYTHPALGGGFGPGFKIEGGYDFVGDGAWPEDEEKKPDEDPMDNLGHGTHVSGIIAGKSDLITGVAPDATLRVYKVFAKMDATTEDVLIDAFLKAYDDGADVITASIGGLGGWSDNAWAVVASRIVDQGVLVTISAGNDGQAGPFAASSGSSGAHVLAISSIDGDVIATTSFNATFSNGRKEETVNVPYMPAADWYPSDVDGWPVIPLGLDTTVADEACSPLPNNTRNLTHSVVLVRRGGCNFSQKQENLAAFGATHVLIYTNEMPIVAPSSVSQDGSIAMITREAGAAIIKTIKAGGNVTADFTTPPMKSLTGVPNEETGGAPSYFTSLGATNDLFIKPDVAAPGGQILSSYLNDEYAVFSGTSMACPYVAGIAALYISKHGGRSTHGPDFAKNLAMRIISSGEAVKWHDGTSDSPDYDFMASVAQVGTGLVNASKVLDYSTSLSFVKFALNDTRHFNEEHTVEITNAGDKSATYDFSVENYGGINAMLTDPETWGTPRMGWGEEVLSAPQKMDPEVSLPNAKLTIQPGETKSVKISFKAPTGLEGSRLPLYSGKVVITGSNGESLGVPFLGLASDLEKDIGDIFEYPIDFPSMTSTRMEIPIAEKSNFTFDLDPEVQDFPAVYSRIGFGTRELRWDIFDDSWTEENWEYPPVIGKAGYVGSATSWSKIGDKQYFNASSDDVNDLIALPLKDLSRDIVGRFGTELWWLGRLANGSQIAEGRYNMRFAVLKPFADPQDSKGWDVFKTPAIDVLPLED